MAGPARASAPRCAVIVLAAGEGRRVGAVTNKVMLPLAGMPVFIWPLRTALALEYVDQAVVVIREVDREIVEKALRDHLTGVVAGRDIAVVQGGETRHESEWNALEAIAKAIDSGTVDVVVIHDAARPLADEALFESVSDTAHEHGGALPVREQPALLPRDATAALVSKGSSLVGVQTPQAFRARPLLDAYRQAERDGFLGTDTASCVEEYTDLEIHCVPCAATNLKITYAEDVELAAQLLMKVDPDS